MINILIGSASKNEEKFGNKKLVKVNHFGSWDLPRSVTGWLFV
jgi:hypothetical protein